MCDQEDLWKEHGRSERKTGTEGGKKNTDAEEGLYSVGSLRSFVVEE